MYFEMLVEPVSVKDLVRSCTEKELLPMFVGCEVIQVRITSILRCKHTQMWEGLTNGGLECFGTIDLQDGSVAKNFVLQTINLN